MSQHIFTFTNNDSVTRNITNITVNPPTYFQLSDTSANNLVFPIAVPPGGTFSFIVQAGSDVAVPTAVATLQTAHDHPSTVSPLTVQLTARFKFFWLFQPDQPGEYDIYYFNTSGDAGSTRNLLGHVSVTDVNTPVDITNLFANGMFLALPGVERTIYILKLDNLGGGGYVERGTEANTVDAHGQNPSFDNNSYYVVPEGNYDMVPQDRSVNVLVIENFFTCSATIKPIVDTTPLLPWLFEFYEVGEYYFYFTWSTDLTKKIQAAYLNVPTPGLYDMTYMFYTAQARANDFGDGSSGSDEGLNFMVMRRENNGGVIQERTSRLDYDSGYSQGYNYIGNSGFTPPPGDYPYVPDDQYADNGSLILFGRTTFSTRVVVPLVYGP
jgi:hypothetical protein